MVDEPTTSAAPSAPAAAIGRGRNLGLLAALAAVILLLVGGVGGLLLAPKSAPAGGSGQATPSTVDIGFSQDMLVHHAQGVALAIQVQKSTADPEIRSLAFDIETDQQAEVGEMNGFLDLWGQPRSSLGSHMAWMGAEGSMDMAGMAMTSAGAGGSTASDDDGAVMPGMATATELTKLRGLTGSAADVFFLQLMIRHHEGGATMMQYAAAHAAVPAVRTFAQAMVAQQSREIVEMTDMLATRHATPLPFSVAAPTQ